MLEYFSFFLLYENDDDDLCYYSLLYLYQYDSVIFFSSLFIILNCFTIDEMKKRQSESAIDNGVGSCCTLGRRMGKVRKIERMMIQIGSFITKLSFMKWNLIKICVYWKIFLFSFSFFYIVCKSYKWQKKTKRCGGYCWIFIDSINNIMSKILLKQKVMAER